MCCRLVCLKSRARFFDKLAEELQCETHDGWLKRRLNKEHQVWLRAAVVLRRKSVDVDYAIIPHLTWLEEVERL